MNSIPSVPFKRSAEQLNKELDKVDFFQSQKALSPPAVSSLQAVRIMLIIHWLGLQNQSDIKCNCLVNMVVSQMETKWQQLEESQPGVFFAKINRCSANISKHLSMRYPLTSEQEKEVSRIKEIVNESNYLKSPDELWKIVEEVIYGSNN